MAKMNRHVLFSAAVLLLCMVSCKQQVEKQVVSRYADNRPRVVREYVTVGDKQVLHKEIQYFPGEKKYIEKRFNESGNPDGVWMSWYENGNKNSQGTYRDGLWQGEYKVWYPNGKLFYSGSYDKGERVGQWKFYDSTGVLLRIEECGSR